jgi:uncharacterized RmlC-like cupin family protein
MEKGRRPIRTREGRNLRAACRKPCLARASRAWSAFSNRHAESLGRCHPESPHTVKRLPIMTAPSASPPPKGYRVVRPPERHDRSGHGLEREFGVSRSTAGSAHLSMAYGCVPAGAHSVRHYHPFETAVYIISGKARSYFGANDEEWVDVEAGDFLYIPGELPHSTKNIGEQPVQYILARAAAEDVTITVE